MSNRTYSFESLPLDPVTGGTSVLVAGPSHIGTKELAYRMLAGGDEEGVIILTTNATAADIATECETVGIEATPDRMGIVDCLDSDDSGVPARVLTVSSAQDLTGIGMRYSKLYREFHREGVEAVRTGLFSISTVLSLTELRTVSRFVHTLVGRVSKVEGRDITERKRWERDLRRSERRLDAVFEDPEMLVGVLSPDGRLRDANRTAMQFVDGDLEDLVGEPFWATPWWTDENRTRVRQWVERAAEGEYVEYEADHATADGSMRTVSGTVRPVTDDSGTVVSLIASARDITERREHERELQRRNERLDEFTSVVSHDLRNPLNVATGHLSVVRRNAESDHLDETAHALARMDDLIEDLLTLARAGDRVDDVGTVDLAATIEDCWRNVSPDGATLHVEAEGAIRADRSQLQRLLENLLRNSVEHGSTNDRTESDDSVEHGSTSPRSQAPEDSVEHGSTGSRPAADDAIDHDGEDVTIAVGGTDDGFYVADDGTGIPEAERESVFESGYSTSSDGTGFGLSIVTEIADAHGWQIDVIESANGGSRFEITDVTWVADLQSAD